MNKTTSLEQTLSISILTKNHQNIQTTTNGHKDGCKKKKKTKKEPTNCQPSHHEWLGELSARTTVVLSLIPKRVFIYFNIVFGK